MRERDKVKMSKEKVDKFVEDLALSQGLLQCDSVHKHIKQAEQRLEVVSAITKEADRLNFMGVEDSLLDGVPELSTEPLAAAIEKLRATVSTRNKAGLSAMEDWTVDALIPNFEAVCEEGCAETLGLKATLALLPVLEPKYKMFIDAAAWVCAETLKRAKDVHVRMRVYIGVAHAVHMIYQEKQSGAELKHVASKLKSLGIWSGMPSCIKKALQSDETG